MVRENKNLRSQLPDPEKIIAGLLQQKLPVISLDMVLKSANVDIKDEAAQDYISRVVRELDYTYGLIPMQPGESYAAAEALFDKAEFMIVPDALEIENNILIPGHRFVPFMSEDVFPSEITLKEAGSRKAQSFRKFSGNAEDIIKYHLLMGAETLFDFFAAESNENIEKAQASANPQLDITVLDMKKFYAETDFSEGDTLLVKVIDFNTGVFEFRLGNGKERSAQKIAAYRKKFEAVLENITEQLFPGVPVIEQLESLFANAPEFLSKPAMSLDELIMNDSAFDIAFDEDGSSLVKRIEDDPCSCEHTHDCDCGHEHHHGDDLPDNVTIGSGGNDSFEAMLAKLYPVINMVELDAILLDNLKNRDLDFNSFYARTFGENALPFADGIQEARFFNELEAHFEDMLESYPRDYDNLTGELRALIVDFTMERCTLLSDLADLSAELNIAPELFENLAEVVLLLDEALKIINAPAAIAEDFDFDGFRSGIEKALESGEEALNALRGVLDGND